MSILDKYGALRDLVPFVQFKKHEKHPWRSVNFTACNFTKINASHGCFSPFLNCTNSTKSHNASQIRIYMDEPLLSLFSVSRFVSLCKISEITEEKITRKTGYRRFPERRTDRQAYIYKTFLPEGSNETTHQQSLWPSIINLFPVALSSDLIGLLRTFNLPLFESSSEHLPSKPHTGTSFTWCKGTSPGQYIGAFSMAPYWNSRVVLVTLPFVMFFLTKFKLAISSILGQGCSHLLPAKISNISPEEMLLMIKTVLINTRDVCLEKSNKKTQAIVLKSLGHIAF